MPNQETRKLEALLAADKVSRDQYEEMLGLLNQIPSPRTTRTDKKTSDEGPARAGEYIRYALYTLFAAILLLFTPYTHQLDEIKTALLYSMTPLLLLMALPFIPWSSLAGQSSRPLWLLAAIAGSATLSFALNLETWRIGERLLWYQVACITIAFLFAVFLDSPNKLRSAVRFILCMAFAATVLGFLFYNKALGNVLYEAMRSSEFWGRLPWTALMYTLSNSDVMFSTILNPDFYAVFLVLLMPLALASFVAEEQPVWKYGSLAVFLSMSLSLVLTRESLDLAVASTIAVPVCILLLLRVRDSDSWREYLRRPVILCTLAGTAAVLLLFLPRLFTLPGNPISPSVQAARMPLWSATVDIWLFGGKGIGHGLNWKSVLFGSGPGAFRFYFPLYRTPDFYNYGINNVTSHAHNYYLHLLCEHGLLGLSLFCVFAGSILLRAIRQIRSSQDLAARLYQCALVPSLLSGLVLFSFSTANLWAAVSVTFWALFGLSIAVQRIYSQDTLPAVTVTGQRSARAISVVFACCAALFFARSFPQGLLYYQGAVANSAGIRNMEAAQDKDGEASLRLMHEARHHLEVAVAFNPTFATSYYKLGHVYNQLGEATRSLNAYDKLQETYPNYSEIHLNMAIESATSASMEADSEKKARLTEKGVAAARLAARQSLKPNIQMVCGKIMRDAADFEVQHGQFAKSHTLLREARACYQRVIDTRPLLKEIREERISNLAGATRAIAAINKKLEFRALDAPTVSVPVLAMP